jgi:NhaA family Na+:H+ antiporter
MVVPAALFAMVNAGGAGSRGWGIPMATDIAFALGILALLGPRVPMALKVFLAALAIVDDMGAVLVIAIFYTEDLNLESLALAGLLLLVLLVVGRLRVRAQLIYAVLIPLVWFSVYASGVHATVAGILVALLVPVRALIDPSRFLQLAEENIRKLREAEKLTRSSMLDDERQMDAIVELHSAVGRMRPAGIRLERELHGIQAFLVLPLFALFNAGITLDAQLLGELVNPVSLGIVLGLVVGKQVGVTLFSWLPIRLGWADLPAGVTWRQLYGVACLAGVGFTMSLFVNKLAFVDPLLVGEAKIGILAASIISGVWGFLVLRHELARGRS